MAAGTQARPANVESGAAQTSFIHGLFASSSSPSLRPLQGGAGDGGVVVEFVFVDGDAEAGCVGGDDRAVDGPDVAGDGVFDERVARDGAFEEVPGGGGGASTCREAA